MKITPCSGKSNDVEVVRRQIASLFADSKSGEKRQTVALLTAPKSKREHHGRGTAAVLAAPVARIKPAT